ncbi:MAG: hypothetical protein IT350_07615 [Deltaproteobacteria bacterium]|nr:hypothetical protein [Deltaproteobacteria bacterium]
MNRNHSRALALLALAIACAAPAFAQVGTLEPTLELIDVNGIVVPYQSGAPLPDFEPQQRPTVNLAGTWKKERVTPGDHFLSFEARTEGVIEQIEIEGGGRHAANYDDGAWDDKELPGVEDEMPGDEASPPEPWHSAIWYRRNVDVPADWAGRANRLVLFSSNYITDIWINGEWVGVHEGGYTPFSIDVGAALVPGAANTIAIRVDHPFPGLRAGMVPSWFLADWWDYAGVVHDLYLESAPAVHVVRANVIPLDDNGHVRVDLVVQNASADAAAFTARLRVFHADPDAPGYLTDPAPASIVGAETSVEGCPDAYLVLQPGAVAATSRTFRIRAPRRWTPREPNLYVLQTALDAPGEDVHHTQFGLRTLGRENGKMLVNGRVAFLPGVARHEEWPDTGRTATWDRIRADLETVQDLNALFLRSGHYPNHLHTYLLTDRLGLGVMTELPVYWSFAWNWKVQRERHVALQMFREMLFSNYNRPSILLWGTNNEPFYFFNGGLGAYDEEIRNDYDRYADGRLLTQSLAAGATWGNTAPSTRFMDVVGWTLYYGVFYGDDALADTSAFLDDFHAKFPEHPVIATEYGIWSEADDSQEANQLAVFEDTWAAFAELGALDADGNVNEDGLIAGASWWCVFNWFTKNGLPDFVAPYINSMGLIHMDRVDWKDAAFALADAYEPYFDFGGLGPEPDTYVTEDEGEPGTDCAPDTDDDDTGDDDNAPGDDDAADDDIAEEGDEGDGYTGGGCGC